jgi:hypothetical protein
MLPKLKMDEENEKFIVVFIFLEMDEKMKKIKINIFRIKLIKMTQIYNKSIDKNGTKIN